MNSLLFRGKGSQLIEYFWSIPRAYYKTNHKAVHENTSLDTKLHLRSTIVSLNKFKRH